MIKEGSMWDKGLDRSVMGSLSAVFQRFLHCNLFFDGLPDGSCPSKYLTYAQSLFPHFLKCVPTLRRKRIYYPHHEHAGGGKYSIAFSGYF